MELKVKVTKEILEKSKNCGELCWRDAPVYSNCAVALAVRDIFPFASVVYYAFEPFFCDESKEPDIKYIQAPHNGVDFIELFDSSTPKERLQLPETVVTLQITDEIIDVLNTQIDNWEEVVNASPILELVNEGEYA